MWDFFLFLIFFSSYDKWPRLTSPSPGINGHWLSIRLNSPARGTFLSETVFADHVTVGTDQNRSSLWDIQTHGTLNLTGVYIIKKVIFPTNLYSPKRPWKNLGLQQIIGPRRNFLANFFYHLADNFDRPADNFDHLADKYVCEKIPTWLNDLL